MPRLISLVTVSMVIVAAASSARAEPFQIRPDGGDVIFVRDFEGDFFRFAGEGFSVQTVPDDPFVRRFFARVIEPSCDPCDAGDIFNPGFSTAGEIELGFGRATFGTVTHENVALRGVLDFTVTPLAFPMTTVEVLQLRTPFSFTGSLRGTSGSGEVFAGAFTGQGVVRRLFDRSGNGLYVGGENQTVFQFEAAAAPVPEPATMLLVASGCGAIVARARRRKAAASQV